MCNYGIFALKRDFWLIFHNTVLAYVTNLKKIQGLQRFLQGTVYLILITEVKRANLSLLDGFELMWKFLFISNHVKIVMMWHPILTGLRSYSRKPLLEKPTVPDWMCHYRVEVAQQSGRTHLLDQSVRSLWWTGACQWDDQHLTSFTFINVPCAFGFGLGWGVKRAPI